MPGTTATLYRYLTERINLIDTFAAVNAGDPGYTVVHSGKPLLCSYRPSPSNSEPH